MEDGTCGVYLETNLNKCQALSVTNHDYRRMMYSDLRKVEITVRYWEYCDAKMEIKEGVQNLIRVWRREGVACNLGY